MMAWKNSTNKTGIAFVGCGYVADLYMLTLKDYPDLDLVGVTDIDNKKAERFGMFHNVKVYTSLQDILNNNRVSIVVNLTNPQNHYSVSKASLIAGKHVYTEKPLSMTFSEAEELLEIAKRSGLYIASAPCNHLGETAQTIWKALREKVIGQVRLVYAEIDDGPVYLMHPERWKSRSGNYWPNKDEFEVGATLEHAGYYISLLTMFFGQIKEVIAFSKCLLPGKIIGENISTPDYSVANLIFTSGVVVRLTCGGYAPYDHSMRIIGDNGVLSTKECWNYYSPVHINRYSQLALKAMKHPFIMDSKLLKLMFGLNPKKYPLVRKPSLNRIFSRNFMDFPRGVAEISAAIQEKRLSRISANNSLHINEIVLAIQNSLQTNNNYKLKTSFEPVEPMPWAK